MSIELGMPKPRHSSGVLCLRDSGTLPKYLYTPKLWKDMDLQKTSLKIRDNPHNLCKSAIQTMNVLLKSASSVSSAIIRDSDK